MKKGFKILAIIVMTIISINYVKADETNYIIPIENKKTDEESLNQNQIDYIYNNLIPQYNNKKYIITTYPYSTDIYVTFYEYNETNKIYFTFTENQINIEYYLVNSTLCRFINSNEAECNQYETDRIPILSQRSTEGSSNYIYDYSLYDTNDNIKSKQNFEMTRFYQDNIVIEENENLPKLKDLYKYNSWSEYKQEHLEGYTEVNLDNYEYVLLSLKNYNQTKAFSTNLQVKGQIGITPIYNFGQTSKDSITGVQVQDRCNVSYKNYTSYPFYILKSDLQNNAIYAVKECNNGSSFKFDNNIFDITYITEKNKNNPTVTIGGKTYNVIPYSDLPSTATKNEEDNYIPGESGSAKDTGGLDSAIKGTQQKMSEIWNTFTYFTDFINQIFSVFPDEVKTILLSAFTIIIVIGLIKIFIN